MNAEEAELERFLRGETDPASFPHREHVRMAYELLRRHEFAEVVLHFSRALRLMTTRAGKPQAFNQTVTIAFLGLIAERMQYSATKDFSSFVQQHTELLDKQALAPWYTPERLASEAARRVFVLPEVTP